MNTAATPRAKKLWTGGEKFLLGAILVLIILVVGGTLWRNYVNALPAVTIPTPTLPSPNAYDYFVAAGNAVVDSDKIGYAIEAPSAHHSNTGPDHAYTLAEQAALVRENAGALKTLRQGFAYRYQNPPMRSFITLFPYYAKFRGVARLLRLEGRAEEERGDWAEAVGSQLDAVELGVKVPRGGPLIGMLVGIACQAIGRRDLWADTEHLDAAQARKAARRQERLSGEQVPYADVLQEERWGTQAGIMDAFRNPRWREIMGTWNGQQGWTRLMQIKLYMTSNRRIMGNYTSFMNRDIANAHLPYATHPPKPPLPSDPLNEMMLSISFDSVHLKDADNQTQNALLTATLALRAYRLEHGTYPATLSALVPSYLRRVPEDPFALSGPLRYKPQGTTYLLYSVGPDGRDDGGRAVFDAAKPAPAAGASSDPRRFVQQDSKGDIVAGVNLF